MKNYFGFTSFIPKRRWQKMVMRMKLLLMVMLMTVLQLTASVKGQVAEVNLSMENASLVDFFSEIKNQTDYEFLYNHDLVMAKESVSVDVNQEDLRELLGDVLYTRGLDFELDDNVIIISERIYVAPEIKEEQENKKIHGRITDEDGNTLPGVSVVVKGTSIGSATDIDGHFELSLPANSKTVVFSFIGMIPQEIAYTGQAVIDVVLKADTEQMDEVVVTGYQTIKKGRATGSFQILSNEDLDNVASLDLTQKLQGIAAGVKVNREGEILIRGKATLSAESKPLIVVDGFPWMGSLAEINTNDIDQITVLKDAASTSIYGVRGANGVVVITTKKGEKDDKLRVNYTNSFTISEKPNLDDLDIMNSKQHIDLEWDSYKAAGFFTYGTYNYKSEVGEIYAAMQAGSITEDAALAQVNELKQYDNRSDIEELFFRREMTQKHTVSFDYGSAKNQFYASLSYDENKQKWKGAEGNNMSFTLNDNFKFNGIFALRLNMFGNYRTNKNNGQFASMTRPYVKFLDENGNYLEEANGSYDLATRSYHEGLGLLSTSYNQVQEQRLKDNESKSNSIATNLSFDITPIKGVKLITSVGYNVMNGRIDNLRHKDSYAVRNKVNRFTDMGMNQVVPFGHILEYSDTYSENLTLRTQLNINKEYKDFIFSVNAGLERNSFKTNNALGNVRYNYHPQRLTESIVDVKRMTQGYLNATFGWASEWNTPRNQVTEDRYLSSYFIGSVGYKGKYDLFGSWRLDKTNLFGQSSKYRDQPSWSVGAKWQISEEDFFNVEFIDRLGLKASYGLSGNVEKNTSPFLVANAGTDYFTGASSLSVANPENPLLGWEKSYTTNIGLDFALFNNKISGSIEYYNKFTEDVLAPVNVDPTTGFGGSFWSTFSKNNGEIINRGIDINIAANILTRNDFRYDVNFNFSYNYNKVQNLDKSALTRSEYIMGSALEGKSVDYIYGYRNAGLDSEGDPQVYNKAGEKLSWKKMGSLSVEDGKFFGRKTPPYYGSLTNSFTWKNFTADVFITYDLGHFVQMNSYASPVRNAPSNNIHKIYDKRWRKAGDEAFTNIPKLDYTAYSSQDRIQATWNSDYNIDKADVIRLKSINLTYDFTSLINSKAFKSVKVRAGIENLWHWTAAGNDKVYDNNVNPRGVNSSLYHVRSFYFPEFKTFTFGLNMTF